MKKYFKIAAGMFFVACMIQTAAGTAIEYASQYDQEQDRWQYDYTITNNLDENIFAFAIYFGSPDNSDTQFYYSDLAIGGVNLDDWDGWLDVWNGWFVDGWNPRDPGYRGFERYEAGQIVAFSSDPNAIWLAPGEYLELSISFNWLGDGTPVGQFYEMLYSDFATVLDDGFASYKGNDIQPVPESQTFMLMGMGLIGLAAYYRRSRKR